ncbi:hypothetical protein QBC47DRAFT_187674 [Echria macrotheca]|uniref:Uncharacterized protein n=1 Tax=Echria macrotheca TaxID=438768 RepID=A0AAJ0BEU9_9PEZI|nr:hypothetical protein QBC47DRAFT_187674 [Echria macrotheca]
MSQLRQMGISREAIMTSYKTSKIEAIPVIDDDPVEDPIILGPGTLTRTSSLVWSHRLPCRESNYLTYLTVEQDERETISKSNIIKGRTRYAKPTGTYTEPSDE